MLASKQAGFNGMRAVLEGLGPAVALDLAALGLGPREIGTMKVVTFVGKGGGGKTSLCVNLAVVAARLGFKVAILDTDPNLSASEWRRLRGGSDVLVRSCIGKSVKADVDAARKAGVQLLLIDTAAEIGEHLGDAIKMASFVLMPSRPAQLDVTQTARRVELVRRFGRPFAVLVDAAPAQRLEADARLVAETRSAVKALNLPLFRGQITARRGLIWAISEGKGIAETEPAGPATRELERLFVSILKQVTGKHDG